MKQSVGSELYDVLCMYFVKSTELTWDFYYKLFFKSHHVMMIKRLFLFLTLMFFLFPHHVMMTFLVFDLDVLFIRTRICSAL